MKCKNCPHFKILYDPIGKYPEIWDFGRAKCEKYDLVADFTSTRNLNKLECVGDSYKTKTMSELCEKDVL